MLCSFRKLSSFAREPDIELLDIISVKCSTVDLQKLNREVNKQQQERNHKPTKKNSNPTITNKHKYKIDYFIGSPEKEAGREATVKLTKSIHNEFKDMFSGVGF